MYVNILNAQQSLNTQSNLPKNRPKVYALVVGISDYKVINDLKYAHIDAIKMYNFLKSPEGGAVKEIKLLINSEATRENIIASLIGYASYATKDDLIIFYFSGHGSNGSFCPYDQNTTPKFNGATTTILYEHIAGALERSRAKYKLCVADACYAGGLSNSTSKIPLKNTEESYYSNLEMAFGGTALFMSSRANEVSQERLDLRHGVFTFYYINGLRGMADLNNDKVVTISELYNYVNRMVKTKTNNDQNPVLKGNYDSNMPIGVIE